MITFVVSYPHTYTVAALRGEMLSKLVPETRAITYDDLFAADRLRPGTYVFTDQERLHPAELRLAARFYRRMEAMPRFRVLNDPARVKTRYALLRALAEAGLNDFDVYCADGVPQPRRFPVFLKIASDHSGPLGDLIHDQVALEVELRAIEAEGIPLAGILVVEFCSERGADGAYEKLSIFKIGDRLTLSALLLGDHWNVKVFGAGLGNAETTRDHLDAIRTDRYAEQLRGAFEIAGIDYGRADVGVCGGRLQVYEINTNPNITATDHYVSDEHLESRQVFRARFGSMLHAINLPASTPAVPMNLDPLDGPSRVRRETAKAAAAILKIRRSLGSGRMALARRRSGRLLRGMRRIVTWRKPQGGQ
jgi:hypothetical protein